MRIPGREDRSVKWRAWLALVILSGLLAFMGLRTYPSLQRQTVDVAYNQFPPYVARGPDGKPVGFAVEIFTQAAREAGIRIRWVEIAGSADEAFSEGKADMYPLLTITPQREKQFYVSAPWWENQFDLVSTEGREIVDVGATKGRVIATRPGVVSALSQKLFPDAHSVEMPTMTDMERALCDHRIDGFFSDVRLLQTQLMQRTPGCAGQALHVLSVSGGRLYLGTASTRKAAYANDRIFREIARLAIDGTLTRAAAGWGIFTPYDTARLKQVADAESREMQLKWALVLTLLILALSVIQTSVVRRAKRAAEKAQAEAREMSDRFDEFMKHTPAITFIKNERQQIIYSNEDYYRHTDPSVDSIAAIGQQLSRQDDEVLAFEHPVELTETVRDREGRQHFFLVLKFPFRNAAGATFLGGVALDITAKTLAQKELEQHAKSDLLTCLPNRRNFMCELGHALECGSGRKPGLAVCFVDLDGFKQVNDRLGHEAGDDLLRQVAVRLKQVCRESDMVARLGGDEFTFFLPQTSAAGARHLMARVLDELDEPFGIGTEKIAISATIGISLFPEDGDSAQQLLKHADSAMYRAKQNGKARIEFWRWGRLPEDQLDDVMLQNAC